MKYAFYGREEQIADLERLWSKRTSSFVTCHGRRRIGKSTLIERFAEVSGARFIMIEGKSKGPFDTVERGDQRDCP